MINLTQRGVASLDRIGEILDQTPTIVAPAAPQPLPSPLEGRIEFRDVTLRYGAAEALHRISLEIPAGKTVAVVGHTGSGKSSLVSLIPRLHDPTSGVVAIDDVDVREFDPQALRERVGFVPQETFLFSTTLSENIAFGVKSATREQIEEAARKAGLDVDIAAFPDGYDTVIGERGITLSGGQKQRCAIARAILRNPAILILDDALASVDTVTEERILRSLEETMVGRTTILISHRVSTVRNADHIFVIENGRIAEQGSHDNLVRQRGYYADLYEKQLLEEEIEAA